MAMLDITLEPPKGQELGNHYFVDATNTVMTPLGRVVASTLEVGDTICTVPDGTYVAIVAAIDLVVEE